MIPDFDGRLSDSMVNANGDGCGDFEVSPLMNFKEVLKRARQLQLERRKGVLVDYNINWTSTRSQNTLLECETRKLNAIAGLDPNDEEAIQVSDLLWQLLEASVGRYMNDNEYRQTINRVMELDYIDGR